MSDSSESSVFSIKCTNCAAPLKVLGGGRITTITCEYCNSVLDMTDHYKVVSKFHQKYRPPVPLTLGMQGRIKGVEWTIIGWISYRTTSFPIERWSEFFLYSPLYGYGWLIYEEGNFSFSKRVRNFPLREWQDKKSPRTVFYQKGHFVAAEAPYNVEIDFVQGELSWIAKFNDRVRCWDYNGVNRRSLSIEKSKGEIEVYLNEKLDSKKVYDSFGIKEDNRVKAKLSTTERIFEEESLEETEKAISTFSKWMSALLLILFVAILASFISNKTVMENHSGQPFEEMFTIHSSAFLSKIEIKTPSPIVLDAYRFSLYKSDKKILSLDKSKLFSVNPHLRYTWLTGDKEVLIYLKLDEGFYRASLERLSPHTSNQKITVTIQEKIIRLVYILPLFILILIMLIPALKQNLIPRKYQKFFWWGAAGAIGFALFGLVIVVFIVAFYFFVQPVIDGHSTKKEW